MVDFDVVIIGGGGAGCAAALEASGRGARTAILTIGKFEQSKTARAQGGIQAAFGPGDDWDQHMQDTLRAGENAGQADLVRTLTQGAKSAIQWLLDVGVEFDRTPNGDFRLQTAGGLSHPRILSCGDQSGNRIIGPLHDTVATTDIDVQEHRAVMKISPEGNALALELRNTRTAASERITTAAVVIASGGARSAASADTPDTITLAENSGLALKETTLTQFHPTGVLTPKAMRGRPAPEGLRAAGADLLDKDGASVADPLLTRKQLCDAINAARADGRGITTDDGLTGVVLNTPRIDATMGAGYTAKHYASFYDAALATGIDIAKDTILVHPIPHYSLGGIVIDTDCATSMPGVFAAGEATWGVHGNDRLMGNSLLEIFVFGRIAGQSAADFAAQAKSTNLKVASNGG